MVDPIPFLLAAATFYWRHNCLQLTTPVDKLLPSYDYVIIGGGSGGSVMAGRLSEHLDRTVLLIEAGGADNEYADIPFLFEELLSTPFVAKWNSTPQQRACRARPGASCELSAGNSLGGGSSHNQMIYNRGSRITYDEWAAAGATGWSYNEILQYFLKAEQLLNYGQSADHSYHGKNGPLFVELDKPTPLVQAFMNAAVEMGEKVGDHNGQFPNRFSAIQRTAKNGRRWSTQRAYLDPALSRPNLHVVCFAKANRILFDHKVATGVQFQYFNRTITVRANREVILSAGAIRTPQVLMLSGIGDARDLTRLGIPIVANLPGVGRNFHNIDGITVQFLSDIPTKHLYQDATADDFFEYKEGFGKKLEAVGVSAIGNQAPPTGSPFDTRIVYFMDPFYYGDMSAGLDPHPPDHDFYINICNLKTRSRGRITISSSDPNRPPVIDPQMFTDPTDRATIIAGTKWLLGFNNTRAFRSINARVMRLKAPPCGSFPDWSDKQLDCWIEYYGISLNNYAGTAKIGQRTDSLAVVDPRLRVMGGVQRLRVADASVMPQVSRGNTNAVVIMIAEKAADMVKQDNL